MNQDITRIYLAIRKLVPTWPAYKALASARESFNTINKIFTS